MSVELIKQKNNDRRNSFSTSVDRNTSRQRSLSVSDESLNDLPDFHVQNKIQHRPRRHSEIKPPTMLERRPSTGQTNFFSLLPNFFRSNKNQNKFTQKDDATSTSVTSSISFDEKNKVQPMNNAQQKTSSESRATLERSSTFSHDEPTKAFALAESFFDPRSAVNFPMELRAPLCLSKTYRDSFYDTFHTNFIGEFERDGPFVVSVKISPVKIPSTEQFEVRALIRTASDNFDATTSVFDENENSILHILFRNLNLPPIQWCKGVAFLRANEKIFEFDKFTDERQNCKIGFLYQAKGQNDETALFENDKLTEDMTDFLHMLGDRVRLKGFTKYRGDLDVKDDLHGEYSYYTVYENHEIMFNVAPMISTTKNSQRSRIERKGLVSNAFVCIIFQEQGADFNPSIIAGRVTQVYITVQPIRIENELFYKVQIWHRHDLMNEIEPTGGLWKYDRFFHDYFLTLILNSVDAAINSQSLRARVRDQRERLKNDQLRKLIQKLAAPPINDYQLPVTEHFSRSLSETSSGSNSEISSNQNDRHSPILQKRGRFQRFFGVFSARTTVPNEPSTNSTLTEKESIRRKTSIKSTTAPAVPNRTSIHHKNEPNDLLTTNETTNNIPMFPGRSRSNSSPIDINMASRLLNTNFSPIKEEFDGH